MPTTHHHPLMKLSINLMRVLIIVHSSLSARFTIHYTGLSPSWSNRIFRIPSQMSFGWRSDICIAQKHFFPSLLPQFCKTQLSICTSWHLNMWNVTDYRAHSLVPSAAVRESAVSISFQERQAEGQRATFIYIPESHSNSLMHSVTNPKHQIYTADLTYPNAMKGIKLSIQVEKSNVCACDRGGAS